ncbi:MAG: response regulator [Pirellulales bacterium]|nr:response regulator [Pirellulales bacterium]
MAQTDVLIIDDDQSWIRSVAHLLEDAGFSVEAAEDGEKALELLMTEHPALVISDVHLPGINGLELLRQFRQHDHQTPVLMVSAEDRVSIQERAMSDGANAFLRKPISASLLMCYVRLHLGDRRTLQREPGKNSDDW